MAELFGGEIEPGEGAPALDAGSEAVGVALARARRGNSDTAADRFLERQEQLIVRQMHHLDEQLRTAGLDRWFKRLKLTFQALTIVVGLLALGVVASMAWSARGADGLVIKPFSMPPALAQRGVTGEAVASKIMDRLATIAEIARPSERQKSIDADWGQHISIEIPETGVSLSQVDQFLREKLGHQRRITGEISIAPDGTLTLDARIGSHPLAVQSGPEADLDKMETKVAEEIYGREQPISGYQYLANQGRWQEALERSQASARAATTPEKKAVDLNGVALALQNLQGDLAAKPIYERALALTPNINHFVPNNLSQIEFELGHTERALALSRLALARERVSDIDTPEALRTAKLVSQSNIADDLGDFGEALRASIAMSQTNMSGFVGESAGDVFVAHFRSALHESGPAISMLRAFEPQGPRMAATKQGLLAQAYADAGDWAHVASEVDLALPLIAMAPDHGTAAALPFNSLKARALARLGRVSEAQQLVAPLPADCDFCLLTRAEVAEAAHDTTGADHWYAEAVRLTASLPAANEAWGRALLARGDAKTALARFDAAHAQGPRFADATEGRAEALAAIGDAKAADAAFAEAAKLTPKWGRLHLKWGEVLVRLGKADAARAQFTAAAKLDLTPAERTELTAQKV